MEAASPVIYTFDIGGTYTRSGVYFDSHLVLAGIEPTPKAAKYPDGDADAISTLMHMFYLDMVARFPVPDAVAVAVTGRLRVVEDEYATRPGPLNRKDMVLSSPNVAGLNNIEFMRFLEDLGWRVPFHVENDANAMLRSVTAHPTALAINMGTGVAAAVKRNNEIQHFDDSWSCFEIGHGLRSMFPDELTLRCSCGSFGCLEAIIGARALTMRYHVKPELASADVYAAMRRDVIQYLSPAIGDAIQTSGCSTVLLGGRTILGFAEGFDLIGAIYDGLGESHPDLVGVRIEFVRGPDTAGMKGAALALMDNSVLVGSSVPAGFRV